MKTKILMFLIIFIAIIFIGIVNVQAYSMSSVGTAQELAEVLGDATYNGNVVTLENNVMFSEKEIHFWDFDEITLDLNGFCLSGADFTVFANLYIKNGTIEGNLSYWKTLTLENATIKRLNGQAESFTNIKGTSTLNGITLGNLIIEKDATLVVDSSDFEFGYHDYNENGHLCTNNGTILIKDADSEFKIEEGNNLLNNGNIINNGTYINNANSVYQIIIPDLDNCKITSNLTIASKGEKIELTIEPNEGYILQEVSAYKSTDKNINVQMENNSFVMPDYNVTIESTLISEQYDLLEGENNKFTLKSDKELIFKTNGKYKLFNGIKVDDKLISKDNYIAEEGSTIITLKNTYLNSLAVGKHKLEILYNNGTVVTSNFEILQELIEKDETLNEQEKDEIIDDEIIEEVETPKIPQQEEKDETPKTGNSRYYNIYMYVCALIISVIGIYKFKSLKK